MIFALSKERGRTNDPDGMRRRLIDVAYLAFTTRGYHATAMQDLRHDAGVSGGAFSHHFPTKKALGVAVLEQPVMHIVEQTWIEPVLTAATAAEGVAQVFAAIIAALQAQDSISGCPLNNLALELSSQDADMRASVDAVFKRWQQALSQRLRSDQKAGRLNTFDTDAIATLIIAAYSGAMAMAKSSQNTRPLEQCADQLAIILDGLKT